MLEDYAITGDPDISAEQFRAVLVAAGSPAAGEASGMYDAVVRHHVRPAVLLAFFHHESQYGRLGIAHDFDTHNPGNVRYPWLVESGGRVIETPRGRFAKYPTWEAGARDWAARLRGRLYEGAGYRTVRAVLPVYAPPGDGNDPGAYARAVLGDIERWTAMGERTAEQVATDAYIAALRGRGLTVVDARGQLPVNPDPGLRYGLVSGGLAGVKHIIVHWTGDAFRSDFFDRLGIPDDGRDGVIDATLTEGQERRLLHWYAEYHIGRDGGTWGGLAYGTLVMPSGRVWVAWDIGTLTYHAFNANATSYAVCCPLSNGVEPTAAQLSGLREVLDCLTDRRVTPAVKATKRTVLGHSEARMLDARNQTRCPGTLLPHVAAWRNEAPGPAPADLAFDAYAAAHGLGEALWAGEYARDWAGSKVTRRGDRVLAWRGGAVVDVTGHVLDDWEGQAEAAGELRRY